MKWERGHSFEKVIDLRKLPQQPEHMRVFMPGSIGVLERQLAFSHTSAPMYYTDPGRRCSLVLVVIEDAIYLF